MCPETCQKIEKIMITPEATPIGFLRASVEFHADDCASQLSKSLAGVQFLELAAALVSSLDPFAAGNILELLLKKSSSDRTLLPSAKQLKALLESLEPRFADSIIG